MKLLLVLMSINIAVSPTKTTSGLQKRARFWKFGKKKTTVARSTSSVPRSVSLPTLTAMQSPAATIIVAQIEQPYTLQTVTAVLDLAVTRAKLSTAPTLKSNSAGTVTATGLKPASTQGAIKNDEIQAKETRINAAAVLPSCSEEFLQGKVLNGKYKVGKMIGEGAFSAVFSGSHGNEVVALKCFIPKEGSKKNNNVRNRDQRRKNNVEVRILRKLNHPNVIKILDSFVHDRLQFIVTEMCESNLDMFLVSNEKADLSTAKKIIEQIADAIVYMHRRGIYHRDLKPDNILLKSVDSLAVKVSDFGRPLL